MSGRQLPQPDAALARSEWTWWGQLEGATLAVLLALAGTTLTGYRFGDSNHGITVPILKRFIDPSLYPGDIMVTTGERFPTVFYRGLAAVLPGPDAIPVAFFVLYIAAIAATLAGAYRIGRWAGGPAAGALALAFAFPVRIGLAGEALYRVAFSHSHLASALSIWAIVWFLEGRRLLPLLVLSLGAYNHLLYSAYVLVPITLVVAWEWRSVGTRRTAWRLAAAVVPMLPLAAWSLARATPMTPEWLALLRLRSAHHSFPGHFGADLPSAAALLGLAALAVSRLPLDKRRLFAFFVGATALHFVLGSVFTEWAPLKVVLQYQPHRSWRFLTLLLHAAIASGIVEGFRAGGGGRVIAVITGWVVFAPGFEPLLPLVLLLQAAWGRPIPASWARLAAAGILLGVSGWGEQGVQAGTLLELIRRFLNAVPLGASALAVVVLVGRQQSRGTRGLTAAGVAAATLLWFGPVVYAGLTPRWESGPWRDVQNWVRENTPRSAVLLTPPRESGFRVFSERTIVGEWKDGTQQYFDDDFVKEWASRMESLSNEPYPRLPDERLLDVAYRFRAEYIVLPIRQRPERHLVRVWDNGVFAVYDAWASHPSS